MTRRNIKRIALLVSVAILVLAFVVGQRGFQQSSVAYAAGRPSESRCEPIGGTVMTNLGVVDQSTTLVSWTGT